MADEETKAPIGKEAQVLVGEPAEQPAEEAEAASVTEPQVEQAPQEAENSFAAKRGRMVMAAMVVAVVLSVIAVVVAGIFGLTSRWLTVCPTDLPVNDPAPILWQKMEAASVGTQPLGVTEKLEGETGFKSSTAQGKGVNK
jgi:hypothetical protein